MAGTIINIIPPRLFNFSGVTAGTTMDIVLQKSVDVSQWSDAAVLVRLNSVDATGGYIDFTCHYVCPTEDDPGQEFESPNQALDSPSNLIISDGIAPVYLTSSVTPPFGSALKIIVTGHMVFSGTLSAVFSVDMKVTNFFPL